MSVQRKKGKIVNLLLAIALSIGMINFGGTTEAFADTEIKDTVTIDSSNFPDETFRNYVSKNFDTDKDGVLSATELSAVKDINVTRNNKYETKITTLKGIEYFTELEILRCDNHENLELDVSKNTKLKTLSCVKNGLAVLDVSNNTSLERLYCGANQLTSLELQKCKLLLSLYCGGNKLKELDVTQNTKLRSIGIGENKLAHLDLSKCDKPGIDGNDMQELDPVGIAVKKGDVWTVDLSDIVGKENLKNVASNDVGTYDNTTGIMTYDKIPTVVSYDYDAANSGSPSTTSAATYSVSFRLSTTCEVKFYDTKGSNIYAPLLVAGGEKATRPAYDPAATNYVFDGWVTEDDQIYDFDTPVTESFNLYSKWKPAAVKYTVRSYKKTPNGLYWELADTEEKSCDYGSYPSIQDKEYEGFTMSEIKVDWEALNSESMIKNDSVIDVYYARNTYNVTFDGNENTGGVVPAKKKVAFGMTFAKPAGIPTKQGYTFAGWQTEDGKAYDFSAPMGSRDIVLKAKWIKNVTKIPQTMKGTSAYSKIYGAAKFKLDTGAEGSLTYGSANRNVADVDSSGIVTVKGIGIAKITVTAEATERCLSATKIVTVTVIPKTNCVKKVTSKKVRLAKKGYMKVYWTKDTKASGYQIRYSQDSKFSKGNKYIIVGSAKTVCKKIDKLKKGKKYYVQVRAYKRVDGKTLYGGFSGKRHIIIR